MSLDPQLVIMAKAPLIGRVKTRLARDIGGVEALRFFREAAASLIRRVGRDPRWRTVIAVSPDRAVHEPGIWPADIPRIGQGGGDLGARMGSLFRDLPPGPAVIVGADIPGIEDVTSRRRLRRSGGTTRCWARRRMAATGLSA